MGPFQNILMLVDNSFTYEQGLSPILKLCNEGAIIHLLHNRRISAPYPKNLSRRKNDPLAKDDDRGADDCIDSIKQFILALRPDIIISSSKRRDLLLYHSILRSVVEVLPDLIVINTRNSLSKVVYLNYLMRSCLIKVRKNSILIVQDKVPLSNIHTVIVPVSDQIPETKLNVLASLARANHLKIHVISFQKKGSSPYNDKALSDLVRTFRLLKERLNCSVFHKLLPAVNHHIALINYCNNIHADLLLIDSDFETQPSFWKKNAQNIKLTLRISN